MPNNYGYIGRNPDDTSVIVARQQFVASGVTTTLTFAAGYTPGYIDAYVNGVRQLEGTDYNATDSTTVSFDTPLANNDNVELVAYKAYDVVAPSSLGNLTVSGNLTVTGLTTTTANTGNIGIGGSILSDVTVVGNARVVGVLTVGSGTVTIDPGDNSITGVGTISITGGGSITGVSTLGITSAYFEIPPAGSFPRNLVINGDQRISQRLGIGGTDIGPKYITDRFLVQANTNAHIVGMGSTGNGLPTRKLQHYLRMQNVVAQNAVNSFGQIRYQPDSLDLANFGWDMQDPESKIIISWYSRSSIDLTGAMLFIIPQTAYNGATRRMYSHEFTQSANTWTHHYVVIPGDSSLIPGVQYNDQESTAGASLYIAPHYGSDFTDNSAVLDQWKDFITSQYVTDMPQDWRNTAGATFDLTGVQIEVAQQGQTRPTPFEHIPYDMSLKRCQRYYQEIIAGRVNATSHGMCDSAGRVNVTLPLHTAPRVNVAHDGDGTLTQVGDICVNAFPSSTPDNITSISYFSNLGSLLTMGLNTSASVTVGDAELVRFGSTTGQKIFTLDVEF